ncbi:MAG: adenylate cyclase regulatory domain-containing protein [Thermoleophilaceae bacterium]
MATTDFDAEGLLDGVDGDAREARRRLLDELLSEGVPLDELRAAVAEGRLALIPVERALTPPGPRHSFTEVAEKSGLGRDFLTTLTRALGLPLPEDEDDESFTDSDLEAAQTVAAFRAAAIPDDAILEAARVLGNSMSQVVAANRSVIGRTLFRPGTTEYDLAMGWAAAARELNPGLERIVTYVLRAQQIAQLRQDVSALMEMSGGGATTIAVAFADLVGFTRLGEHVPADELGSVAGRLTELAIETVAPPVRLVKMIGDAAMLASVEARALLDALLDLVEAADAEGEDFPQLRGGAAWGEALPRAGDWFGRPVNLASRITEKARPGSTVATAALREAVGDDGYRWSPLPGRRRFKGISGEVELFRVRRAEPDR